jgi:spermidine/putrescine transport system substrate-binding protein
MIRARLVIAILALGASLGLAACGSGSGSDTGATTVPLAAASGEPSGKLTISNWALYIDKQTIPDFEDKTGIDVNYIEDINSYDEFFGKMQPLLAEGDSGGRSLMVAGDSLARKMYALGYLQRIDPAALKPALSHLSPVATQGPDAAHAYSIPWQGGMTGLIVNTDLAPEITSVNDIFDPKYKGKIEMVSELPEVVPLVMKADGIDPLRASKQEWLDTIAKIKAAGESGQIRRFTGGDYARDIANGDVVAVIGWAADAFQLQADNPNLSWVMPDEGCILWWDNWVVPVGAPNPTAAYAWINYTYEPDHQAQIDAWTGAVTPVSGVKPVLQQTDPEMASSELVFPSKEYTRNCSSPEPPPGNAADEREIEQAWADAIGL